MRFIWQHDSMRFLARPLLAITLCLVSISLANLPVRAGQGTQSTIELRFGEDVSGSVSDDHFRQVYVFTGRRGDVLSITMRRTEGDLDPFLLLADSNGRILAISDDDGDHLSAAITLTSLPAEGRYFIMATRFGQELGSTSGTYTLVAERSRTGQTQDSLLRYGDSVLGRISAETPLTFYFLRAERGDVINITMKRTSGDLDPHLDLVTPDGIVLTSNDDDPTIQGTLDAAITSFTIPRTALYLILATRFGREAGDTEGTYVLSVSQTPPEILGTRPDNARLIDYGMTVRGVIDDENFQRFYRFEARRGDVVAILLKRQDGSLIPAVRVLDAELLVIAEDDDRDADGEARLVALTLPQAGSYYVTAGRLDDHEGRTTGAYTLSLNGRPGITNGEALEINYDASTSGEITDDNVSEEYVFIGEAGDVIRISMERASGDLDPLVTLFDSDRKQIAFDDDSGPEKDALLTNFTLPQDGMYIIVASRFDQEQGTTQGAYVLTLERLQSTR